MGWEEEYDDRTGATYWYNGYQDESVWLLPDRVVEAAAAAARWSVEYSHICQT